ncbi:MAG: hypothetical protein ACPGJV_12765 [Bacteriovoracaceae bacterium]
MRTLFLFVSFFWITSTFALSVSNLEKQIKGSESWCKEKAYRKNYSRCKSELKNLKKRLESAKRREKQKLKRKAERVNKKKREQELAAQIRKGDIPKAKIYDDESDKVKNLKEKYNSFKGKAVDNWDSFKEVGRDYKLYNSIIIYEKRNKNGKDLYIGTGLTCYKISSIFPTVTEDFPKSKFKEIKKALLTTKNCIYKEPTLAKQVLLLKSSIPLIEKEFEDEQRILQEKKKERQRVTKIENKKRVIEAKKTERRENKINICLSQDKLKRSERALMDLKASESRHGVSRHSEKLKQVKAIEHFQKTLKFFTQKYEKSYKESFSPSVGNCSSLKKKGSETIYEVRDGKYSY